MDDWLKFIDVLLRPVAPRVKPVVSYLTKKEKANLGFGTGLMLLMFCLSFTLFLYDPCYSNVAFNILSGNVGNCVLSSAPETGLTGGIADVNAQLSSVFDNLGIGVLGTGALIALAVGFPNGYAIFAPVAYLLLGALNIPTALLVGGSATAIPNELRVFLLCVFGLLNLFVILEFTSAKRL